VRVQIPPSAPPILSIKTIFYNKSARQLADFSACQRFIKNSRNQYLSETECGTLRIQN
jgi:hypothetical protein